MIYDSYDFIHGDIIEILAELCTDSMVSGCFGGGSIRDVVVRCHESSRVLLSNVIHADHLRTAIDKGLAVQAPGNVFFVAGRVFLEVLKYGTQHLDVDKYYPLVN